MSSNPPREPLTIWDWARLVAFAIIVIVSINYSHALAVRLVGFVTLAHAVVYVWRRRISYGWQGQPASGYITGAPAIAVASLLGVIGGFFVAEPQLVVEILWPGLR